MKVAVLGTGNVGRTIGTRLVELGHEVFLGSRTADNPAGVAWAEANGDRAHVATFERAAAQGELVFNCTSGAATLDALGMAGEPALAGKVLVDVANPLDFSGGMPPTLLVKDTDSLGEQVQRAFPSARVVKSLNTMNCDIMVRPAVVAGRHNVFVCGDDEDARAAVASLLADFGWRDDAIIDLGPLSAARGTEMFLPLWLRLYQVRGNAQFNIAVVG